MTRIKGERTNNNGFLEMGNADQIRNAINSELSFRSESRC